jgi:hypothetical protein
LIISSGLILETLSHVCDVEHKSCTHSVFCIALT